MDNVINRNFEDISKPKPRLLENSIKANNVNGDTVEEKNIDMIKTKIKTESNEVCEIDLKSENVSAVHEGKKPFQCNVCSSAFCSKFRL